MPSIGFVPMGGCASMIYGIVLNNSRNNFCWTSVSDDQLSNISLCLKVRETASLPSAKNWDKVIPSPLQTLSNV